MNYPNGNYTVDAVKTDDDFNTTGETIKFETNDYRALCTVSADARKWDEVAGEVTHAVYNQTHDFFCYCEVKVQTRTRTRIKDGLEMKAARLRFWNTEDGFGEWYSVDLVAA
jgi:hypothetical protein